jgi:hypothetical protein
MEAILKEKQLNREPIEPMPQVVVLPQKTYRAWGKEDTLQPVRISTIDVQVMGRRTCCSLTGG